MTCYTVKEVEAHNNSSDCWVIYKEKVYNVTPFLEDHPGGQEIVLEHAGTDCTNAFEDVGHSESAYEMLKEFYIGDIVEFKDKNAEDEEVHNKKNCCKAFDSVATTSVNYKSQDSQINYNLPVIGAAICIGAAIAYNAFFRK